MDASEALEQFSKDSEKHQWLNYLAITTIFLAVCATLASFKEGNNSIDTVINQSQAANQWAYYQSKSIKGYLYELQVDRLKMELKLDRPSLIPQTKEELEKKIEYYNKELARYAAEKREIMAEARKYEKERDQVQRRAQAFGLSIPFLQVGILLSSVAALLRRKMIWIVGTVIGAVGVVYFVDGFLLWFN